MAESGQNAPLQKRGFLSLPSTRAGKWAGRLLLASLVLVFLNTVLVMPVTEREVGLGLVQSAYNIIAGLAVLSAGLSGLYALVMERERSWVPIVAALVFVAVLVMMVQDLVSPG